MKCGLILRRRSPKSLMKRPSTLQTVLRSFLVQSVNMNSVGVQPADVVVEPDVTGFDLSEFSRTDEIAAVGEAAARILVEDSGPGVDPDLLSRIFDPFFTTRDGGSGLGLPVAHRTIEAHQGTIMVDQSELGGARFTIDLPIDRAGPAS